MKKILTLSLSATLLFAGCSGDSKPEVTRSPAAISTPASPVSQSTPSEKEFTKEDIEAAKAKKQKAQEEYDEAVRGKNARNVPDPEDKNFAF